MKALLLGSLAAAVGAGVYRMILFGSGWNFSIVAIVVGYVVGGAVRTGSGDRGGRFYQFLAMFLTYSALVGMFLPTLWKGLSSRPAKEKVAEKRIEKEIQPERREEAAPRAGRRPRRRLRLLRKVPRPSDCAEGKAKLAAPEAKGREGDGKTLPLSAKDGWSVVLGCDAALLSHSHGRVRLFGSYSCPGSIRRSRGSSSGLGSGSLGG